jgi:hypothetical protein
MEHAKQANGSGHELSIGHSPSSARKKAVRKKAESPRPLRKEAGTDRPVPLRRSFAKMLASKKCKLSGVRWLERA